MILIIVFERPIACHACRHGFSCQIYYTLTCENLKEITDVPVGHFVCEMHYLPFLAKRRPNVIRKFEGKDVTSTATYNMGNLSNWTYIILWFEWGPPELCTSGQWRHAACRSVSGGSVIIIPWILTQTDAIHKIGCYGTVQGWTFSMRSWIFQCWASTEL